MDIGDYLPTLVVNLANELWRVGSGFYRRQFGVGMPEVRLLLHLGRQDGQIASEISRAVRLDKAAVSRSLKGLEEAGLVRLAARGPRRTVALTAKGRALAARIAAASLHRQAWLLAEMAPDEVARLKDTLRTLTERVAGMDAG